jgi:predicted transcriptional regulator
MAKRTDTPLMPGFIAELAKFCRSRHGRVTRLAEHLGIAQPHVSAWLTGRQEPSGEHTLRIQMWLAAERIHAERPAAARRKVSHALSPPEEESAPIWLL